MQTSVRGRDLSNVSHLETPLGRVSQARVIARVAATQLEWIVQYWFLVVQLLLPVKEGYVMSYVIFNLI